MAPETWRDRSSERGSGLVMAIAVLALLTAAGIILLNVVSGETSQNVVDLSAKQTFYLAETGLEKGREALRQWRITNQKVSVNDKITSSAANGVLDFDPQAIRPVYDAAGKVTGFSGYGDDVPLVAHTDMNGGAFIAFLTNDPAEGRTTLADANDRVTIWGIAAGRGRSFEVVEGVVETGLNVPPPPTAITLVGPQPQFQGGNSNSKFLTGNDCSGTGVTGQAGLQVPVVGVIGAQAEALAELGIQQPDTYLTGTTTGAGTVADISGSINPAFTDCRQLIRMTAAVRDAADVVGDANTPITAFGQSMSTATSVFIEGDYTIEGGEVGYGMLWITGTLTFKGGGTWNGPIFAVGKGHIEREGGGQHTIAGGALVANVAGPDGLVHTVDDCAGPDGTVGTADDGLGTAAAWLVDGGGNGNTIYCSTYNKMGLLLMPVKLADFRQH